MPFDCCVPLALFLGDSFLLFSFATFQVVGIQEYDILGIVQHL